MLVLNPKWPFRPKHVVEINRINFVFFMTRFIVITVEVCLHTRFENRIYLYYLNSWVSYLQF